jgi:hypothetical protein
MKWLKAQYTRYRYWVWVAAAVAVAILLFVLRGLVVGSGKGKISLPEIPEALKAKVAKAEEEALVARVEARVTAEQEVKELEEVAKIDDGVERRKRLAKMLENL